MAELMKKTWVELLYHKTYPLPLVLSEHKDLHKGQFSGLILLICSYVSQEFLEKSKNWNLMKFLDAIYIQFLGQRGVGKSSLLNFLLKKLEISEKAKVGSTETTLESKFEILTILLLL